MTTKPKTRLRMCLQETLDAKGMTQTALAAKLNCTRANVQYLCSSDRSPRLEQVHRIANAMGVPWRKLIIEERSTIGGQDSATEGSQEANTQA